MSVNFKDIVLIGINNIALYDNSQPDVYEEYQNNTKPGDMLICLDGMNGEYYLIGEIIHICSQEDDLSCTIPIYDKEKMDEIKKDVKAFVYSHFGIECEPKLIIQRHFH